MDDIRQRFLERGIPYDKIDKELIELIDIFNFHLNMETECCCFGHTLEEGLSIGFDEYVDDAQIEDLSLYLYDKIMFSFRKWVRNTNRVLSNWFLEDTGERFDNLEEFNKYKKDYVDELCRLLKDYNDFI